MAYAESQYKQRITLGDKGNTLILLIAICLVVFVGLAFMKAMSYFANPKELLERVLNDVPKRAH